ncbi:MAG: GGDEF domain-containing protein [Armatimonadetes bacterium]|nr:GGDEF domain-containing protein [Armatimonadota bacterium]
MKTVRDVMTTNVIQLVPSNKIKTAIMLMKGHNIGGMPVVDNGVVLGIVDYQDLLGKDEDVPVQHIMDKEYVPVPPDMTVADAADLMAKVGANRLLVMEESRLVGIVTRGDLLPELGKSFDPITKLPRSDAMRDWGIAALKRGQEITVIFIDLDKFGDFNKKYGHITGDKVLRHVAEILSSGTDEGTDFLCRYAGDEFVIVTLRNSKEARELADSLEKKLRETPPGDLPEPVTGSIGVHGGKRTKEREDVHYEATLDNLINLASKACTAAKSKQSGVASLNGEKTIAEPPAAAEPESAPTPPVVEIPAIDLSRSRLRIRALNFSWEGGSLATAEVQLAQGEVVQGHSCSGFALGRNALRLVSDATAGAVCKFLPAGYGVVVDSINLIENGINDDIVLVTALIITPQAEIKVSGSSIVKQDAYRAAAAALLDAVNRQIGFLGLKQTS